MGEACQEVGESSRLEVEDQEKGISLVAAPPAMANCVVGKEVEMWMGGGLGEKSWKP